jgi:hypothetical protein
MGGLERLFTEGPKRKAPYFRAFGAFRTTGVENLPCRPVFSVKQSGCSRRNAGAGKFLAASPHPDGWASSPDGDPVSGFVFVLRRAANAPAS